MQLERTKMQKMLAEADRRRFYQLCLNISLAGEKYKVRSVSFFAKDERDPASDFVCVEEHADSFAVITVETMDPDVIAEGIAYLLNLGAAENELRTDFPEALSLHCVTDRFEVSEGNELPCPTYSIGSVSELVSVPKADGIEISLLNDELRKKFGAEISAERAPYASCFRDIRRYLLIKDGRLTGYLRAECGYRNIYDVGWVFVPPDERGHGYAPMLVSHYAHDCVKNGLFPNYGLAVTPESERVAIKCGFSKDAEYNFRRQLTRKI